MIEATRGSRQVRAETSHVESAIYNVRTSIAVSSYHTECMLIYSLALRLVYCALHDTARYRTQTKRAGGRRSSWSARGAAPLKRPTACTPTDHCRSFARRAPVHSRAGREVRSLSGPARIEHQSAAQTARGQRRWTWRQSHEDTAENLHWRKCASVACLQLPMRFHDREIEISTQHDDVGSFAIHLPGA
jgi:hypothetical protein